MILPSSLQARVLLRQLLLDGEQEIYGMRVGAIRGSDHHGLISHCGSASATASAPTAAPAAASSNTDQAANYQEACYHAPAQLAPACLNSEPQNGEAQKQQHHSAGASPSGRRDLMVGRDQHARSHGGHR
jgi:hypothetical protein